MLNAFFDILLQLIIEIHYFAPKCEMLQKSSKYKHRKSVIIYKIVLNFRVVVHVLQHICFLVHELRYKTFLCSSFCLQLL